MGEERGGARLGCGSGEGRTSAATVTEDVRPCPAGDGRAQVSPERSGGRGRSIFSRENLSTISQTSGWRPPVPVHGAAFLVGGQFEQHSGELELGG